MTFWTDDRIAELRRLAPDHTASQIAAKMGASSRNVIIGKMNRLGMSTPRVGGTRKQAAEAAATVVKIRAKARSEIREKLSHPWQTTTMPRHAPTEPVQRRSRYAVDIWGLRDDRCHWPLFEGDEPISQKLYCGDVAIEGLPYCGCHARIAYTGARG